MRNDFTNELYKAMSKNGNIWLLTGDLGFGFLEKIRDEFPDRFINCGTSEQAMIGIACGLALEGKIPFVYSISTFLLNRPFEWIRNYVNHENIPVKLVGTGREKEYERDEFSHWAVDTKSILSIFPNIVQFWPEYGDSSRKNLSVKNCVREMVRNGKPSFLSLSRFDKLPRPERPRYSSSSLHERAVLGSMYSLPRIHPRTKSPRRSASEYKKR